MNKAVLKPLVRRAGRKSSPEHKKGIFSNLKQYITISEFIKCAAAFLLSGTSLIAGSSPLGFSMFIACFGGKEGYACGLFAILGLIAAGCNVGTVGKYITAAILFSLVYERFLPARMKNSRVSSVTGAVSLFLSGLLFLFITMSVGGYPLMYDVIVLVVEAATVWISSLAFSYAVPLAFSLNIRRTLTAEETISLALLFGGIICGMGKAEIGGIFSVTGTLCVLTVLIFATRFGSLHGCAAGIVMGIISCLSRGRIDACAASFALSGLCAGYFSKNGKWAACLSFVMANAVVTILSNGSTEVLINIFDTLVAATVLYCVPNKIFEAISSVGTFSQPGASLAAETLGSVCESLRCCEKSFRRIHEMRDSDEANRMLLYKRTAHKVCSGCGLRKYCWGRDRGATNEAMDKLLSLMQEGKEPLREASPPHCLRAEQFVNDFSDMYEIYKTDCVWTGKVSELQNAVYNSFNGITKLLLSTSTRLLEMPECDSVSADDIKYRLRHDGIGVKSVFVSGKGDDTQITITLENCGGFGRCESAVRKVLLASTGKSFVKLGLRSCGECRCRYVVKPAFSVSSAVASAIKTNRKVSGDYAVYALIDRSTYAIILCDGMGSGETAREESRTCASMLMRLLESGMDAANAISLINSMLLCASTGTLAAIDLCLISLTDGTTRLFKCGGAGTFAKTDGSVTHINTATLPAGAVVGGDTAIYNIDSKQGSMLVLVSDGVTVVEDSKLPWIKNVITEYDGTEPEPLARLILDKAKKRASREIKDDITVVAAFIG